MLGPSSNIAFTRSIRRALYALLSHSPSRPHDVSSIRSHHLEIPHRPSLDVSRPPTPQPQLPPPPTSSDPLINNNNNNSSNAPNDLLQQHIDYLQLPPEDEMDALVARFFVDTGALFPFVHAPSFMETYTRVVKNTAAHHQRRFRRSWLGLLNAILAMATVTSTAWSSVSATERAARAEIFYMRARVLCLDQMLHTASLETGGLFSFLVV